MAKRNCVQRTPSFYSCVYRFRSISSLIVDQHLVATPDNEPIEDVDPVTPNVDLVALDVVMDIPLRRSARARRPKISDDYIVYL